MAIDGLPMTPAAAAQPDVPQRIRARHGDRRKLAELCVTKSPIPRLPCMVPKSDPQSRCVGPRKLGSLDGRMRIAARTDRWFFGEVVAMVRNEWK